MLDGIESVPCFTHHPAVPQSLAKILVHTVFSTKDRRPFLRDPALRAALHEYLGGISKRLECAPLRIGGVEDHVHLLARLGRTMAQAEWIKELKRASNLWLKEQPTPPSAADGPSAPLGEFAWQSGYACFSVSVSNLDAVTSYIDGQAEHHQRVSFQEELRALLARHGEHWDEQYVWD